MEVLENIHRYGCLGLSKRARTNGTTGYAPYTAAVNAVQSTPEWSAAVNTVQSTPEWS